ncbi:MAG: cyclohexa-1,5-dienecarbonyl-CoA hydratase [Ignavibacteriae bacterium]|nr:MAG: cyclohexa-1,5-dienecarbonyl-CoA hydratase [Ignavibacteriota bacterium]
MNKIKLDYLQNDSVAHIVLNAPKGNVLDAVMMNELTEVFSELKTNNNIKVITFEGEGNHFSFGASVDEHKKELAAAMLKSFHELFYNIINLSIPTIAKISGQCLGGGLELALICNFLFADKTAKLGQPEIILGVFPPPASVILPLKIGSAKAEEILLTGKTISADEAKAIGIVNEVFENKNILENSVNEFIEKNLLPKSASSLRYAVKAARSNFNCVLRDNLKVLESLYVNKLMETNDANEGINSFLEKRKPVWQNN